MFFKRLEFKDKINSRFNLIRFSDRCEKWREEIVESTEQNCHQSIAWLANLSAHGNTCTLDALKVITLFLHKNENIKWLMRIKH